MPRHILLHQLNAGFPTAFPQTCTVRQQPLDPFRCFSEATDQGLTKRAQKRFYVWKFHSHLIECAFQLGVVDGPPGGATFRRATYCLASNPYTLHGPADHYS